MFDLVDPDLDQEEGRPDRRKNPLTDEEWLVIYNHWRRDRKITMEKLGEIYGVSQSTISRRKILKKWRRDEDLGEINATAQLMADANTISEKRYLEGDWTTGAKDGVLEPATREESESVRATVLIRHRSEWAELELCRRHALDAANAAAERLQMHEEIRSNLYVEGEAKEAAEAMVKMLRADQSAWTVAKLAADTARANITALGAKQDAERKAWGLDEDGFRRDVRNMSDEELEEIVGGVGD